MSHRCWGATIKNLVAFIESGGVVDFVIPEEKEAEEGSEPKGIDYKDLRVTFQEILLLEDKIKLLESKN